MGSDRPGLDAVKRKFVARSDRAHDVSAERPQAFENLEEEILYLGTAEERYEAQMTLLRSQDAFRMRLPGQSRAFTWIACLTVHSESGPFDGQLAYELARELNGAVADLENPLTAGVARANGRHPGPPGVVVHGLKRLSAVVRMWIGFHACANVVDEELLRFCVEGLLNAGPRLVIAVPVQDAAMSIEALQDPDRQIPAGGTGEVLLGKVLAAIDRWNRNRPKLLATDRRWRRLSDVVDEAERELTYVDVRAALLQKPSVASALGTFEDHAAVLKEAYPGGIAVVAGATPTGDPTPGQAAQAIWADPERGRLIRAGFASLLPGTNHEVALLAAVRVAEELGLRVLSRQVLPRAPIVKRLDPRNLLVPCMDGQYRPPNMAYFGKPAWRLKRFDWAEGWDLGGPPFQSEEARRVLSGLPHPIALERAGLQKALAAHYGTELLAELQAQLQRPGVPQAAAIGQLRVNDPQLYDLAPETDEADGSDEPLEDPLEPPTGVFSAAHWRAAGGVLLIARTSLLLRMEETSIEKGFPMRYLRLPYPDVFVHFETPIERVRSDGNLFQLTGFYASEVEAETIGFKDPEAERLVYINFAYRYEEDVVRAGGLQLPFAVRKDDERDMQDEVKRYVELMRSSFAGGQSDDSEDAIFADMNALLAAKVLLYTTLKQARMEERRERTELVAQLKGLKGAKRDKLASKIKRAYDYILVGPDDDADDKEIVEMGRKKMKPHWRTGFFRNQPFGEKSLLRKPVWIAPVLVNAAFAGSDVPPKKTYVLE